MDDRCLDSSLVLKIAPRDWLSLHSPSQEPFNTILQVRSSRSMLFSPWFAEYASAQNVQMMVSQSLTHSC